MRLEIAHSAELGARLEVGASLAVAGACLTLIESAPELSVVELSSETLARTRLGRLCAGDPVNLEPALRAGEALGGHWVQGHVDGLVELVSRRDVGEHSRFTYQIPRAFDALIAEKGSVTLDGVSLTVAARDANTFEVALVPFTLQATTLGRLRPGARCHFEADVVARYVEQVLAARAGTGAGSGNSGGPFGFGR